MEWEIYEFKKTKDGLRYSFYSEGPRGRIGKVIAFQWMRGLGSGTFNLAFGDFNEDTDQLDDRSVSDNHDRLKVLHTVAAVVIDFLRDHPRSIILIKPSTITRARLNSIKMKEQEESDLEKSIRAHITVVDKLPFRIADDDPFLVRKLEEAYKTFEEAPIPDFILKRMREED